MNKVKFLSASSVLIVAMISAAPSFAATSNFSKEGSPGYLSVTGLNGVARFATLSSNFPSGTLNKTKKITSVQYSYGQYANGSTQQVQVCMTRAYSTNYEICQDVTLNQSGALSTFVGKIIEAGKDIHIIHKLTGGTYPATAPTVKDKITVTFEYN